ncbi:MAG: trigger factor, partial [Candidatus Aenigmarchaeota archaeon]|nr:trigger factor [Candidatus Aenigmarchaeota archaeon]
EIDKALNNLRQMKAKEELVDRAIKNGDRVILDINMFLANVPLEHGQSKDQSIIIDEKQFIPGFKEKIIGLHQGEKKEFPLIFPKKYYDQHLAGKKIDFKIEIKKVFQRILPELNDDFAQQVIKGQKLTELKKLIKNNLFQQQQQQADQKIELDIIDQMVNKSTFEPIPEILIDHEQEKMIVELEEQIKKQNLKFDDYLSNLKKTKQELKKELRIPAEKRVKTSLIIKEIAKQEKIIVSEEEINEQIKQISNIYKDQPDVLEKINLPANRHYLSNVIATRKTMEKIKKELTGVNNTSTTKKE